MASGAATHARILKPALQASPECRARCNAVPVVPPLREQDRKPAAARGLYSVSPETAEPTGGYTRAAMVARRPLEVLGKGVEQPGAQHIAGDAADRIEKQMQPLAGHRARLPLLRPRTPSEQHLIDRGARLTDRAHPDCRQVLDRALVLANAAADAQAGST